ncbi:DUF1206 domain-containing protein [Luteimonas deserti]|uniref:DUF1206 domain-containing protein n=1 Tax=Luteimonas deserti TaxID=2752306 RepID=A0A7Z0QSC1_9GAMM|nr:DUF1206 domain-containing protein [Luteimonas deserti]NYZ63239.1 DUF1206 domain-containing protein [Luteimonas deserti]
MVRRAGGWVPPLARLGYAAKGIVFMLVGWIALQAAMDAGSPQGSAGALASLTDERGGRVALLMIAAGLLCHVAWRAVQALIDPEHPGGIDARRVAMRAFYALSGVIYTSLALTAWRLSQGRPDGSGEGQTLWVRRLLEQPFGTWLVMAVGIGVMLYGLQQIHAAWTGNLDKRMTGSAHAHVSRGVRLVGRIGTAARGIVFLPIGWFVFGAGREYRAENAADTAEVLRMLGHGWLLMAVAAGLVAYGIYQLAKAVYRRIDAPA